MSGQGDTATRRHKATQAVKPHSTQVLTVSLWIGDRDWGLRLVLGLGIKIGIGDWDWGLGLWIGIGDWRLGIGIGHWGLGLGIGIKD